MEERGRDFNINRCGSVSSVVERMRGKISMNRQWRKRGRGNHNCDTHESSVDPFSIAVSRAASLLRIVGVEKEMRKDHRLAEFDLRAYKGKFYR